jgi:N-acetylmuramoyl-L-alanine amidase
MLKIFLCLFLFFSLTEGYAEEKFQIIDIRHYEIKNGIRVVVETTGVINFTKGQLKNPERLFFDLKNYSLNKEQKREFLLNNPLLSKIRLGQFDANTVRIVFDLLTSEYEFKIIQIEDPFRLVIDIYSETVGKNWIKEKEMDRNLKVSPKRKIVIDPGHGGTDPGAIGPTGLMEKDVVLDIALKIKELMRDNPEYEIILTRESDIYLPLNERTEIANRVGADLFISLHTNASYNPSVKGIETYILNWTDDEQAIRVAARENAITVKKMKELKGELGVMLASLEREAKRDDSIKLAGYIHNAMISKLKTSFSRNDKGVKQALFYVLVGAKMPSCLLEIAYISNPEEEKLLSNDLYRLKVAISVVEGIESFFAKSDKIKKVKYTNNFLVRADSKKPKNKKVKAKKL